MSETQEARAQAAETARNLIARLIPAAVATLADLLESEKDSVRLAAAEALLDRGGVSKQQQVAVTVDHDEHKRAEQEAAALAQKLRLNAGGPRILERTPDLDTLVVLEGDSDALPVAIPVEQAIDAESRP